MTIYKYIAGEKKLPNKHKREEKDVYVDSRQSGKSKGGIVKRELVGTCTVLQKTMEERGYTSNAKPSFKPQGD